MEELLELIRILCILAIGYLFGRKYEREKKDESNKDT
jgi:hypothetical protein